MTSHGSILRGSELSQASDSILHALYTGVDGIVRLTPHGGLRGVEMWGSKFLES